MSDELNLSNDDRKARILLAKKEVETMIFDCVVAKRMGSLSQDAKQVETAEKNMTTWIAKKDACDVMLKELETPAQA
jgi:hypothetical protein